MGINLTKLKVCNLKFTFKVAHRETKCQKKLFPSFLGSLRSKNYLATSSIALAGKATIFHTVDDLELCKVSVTKPLFLQDPQSFIHFRIPKIL